MRAGDGANGIVPAARHMEGPDAVRNRLNLKYVLAIKPEPARYFVQSIAYNNIFEVIPQFSPDAHTNPDW
jgi:hypothetical protein